MNGFLDEEGLRKLAELLKSYSTSNFAPLLSGVQTITLTSNMYMSDMKSGIYFVNNNGQNSLNYKIYLDKAEGTTQANTVLSVAPGIIIYFAPTAKSSSAYERVVPMAISFTTEMDNLPADKAVYFTTKGWSGSFSYSKQIRLPITTYRGGEPFGSVSTTLLMPWNVLSKTNTTAYTPTADYHPSTKKYVDDAVANMKPADDIAQEVLEQVRTLMSSAFKYKGSVNTYNDLPVDAEVGDTYNIILEGTINRAGDNAVWNGEDWDVLAGIVDLSNYIARGEFDNTYLEAVQNLNIPDFDAPLYRILTNVYNRSPYEYFTTPKLNNMKRGIDMVTQEAVLSTGVGDMNGPAVLMHNVDEETKESHNIIITNGVGDTFDERANNALLTILYQGAVLENAKAAQFKMSDLVKLSTVLEQDNLVLKDDVTELVQSIIAAEPNKFKTILSGTFDSSTADPGVYYIGPNAYFKRSSISGSGDPGPGILIKQLQDSTGPNNEYYLVWIGRASYNPGIQNFTIVTATGFSENLQSVSLANLKSFLNKIEGGNLLEKNNATSYNVTSDYNPAHKRYVDTAISNAKLELTPYLDKPSYDTAFAKENGFTNIPTGMVPYSDCYYIKINDNHYKLTGCICIMIDDSYGRDITIEGTKAFTIMLDRILPVSIPGFGYAGPHYHGHVTEAHNVWSITNFASDGDIYSFDCKFDEVNLLDVYVPANFTFKYNTIYYMWLNIDLFPNIGVGKGQVS